MGTKVNFGRQKYHILISAFLLIFFLTSPALLAQQLQPIPKLEARVTDLTNTLSAASITRLEQELREFEERKGSQVAVLIVASTEPETIEQFGIRVTDEWKLGREGIDDGVLLLVAKDDRKVRIEVGFGLEGVLPDAYAKRIIERVIIPDFRGGDFDGGVIEGAEAVMALVEGEDLPAVTSTGRSSSTESEGPPIFLFLIVIFFVAWMVIGTLLKKKLGKQKGSGVMFLITLLIGWFFFSFFAGLMIAAFSLIFLGAGGGRGGGMYWGGGGSSWGSSGGGGFGGFSGGGGGFGGGGASGGW